MPKFPGVVELLVIFFTGVVIAFAALFCCGAPAPLERKIDKEAHPDWLIGRWDLEWSDWQVYEMDLGRGGDYRCGTKKAGTRWEGTWRYEERALIVHERQAGTSAEYSTFAVRTDGQAEKVPSKYTFAGTLTRMSSPRPTD